MSEIDVKVDVKVLDADAPQEMKIGWKCYEILPGSEEAKKIDEELDFNRQKETDLADRYNGYHHIQYQKPESIGYCSLPVLQFLWGKPWDNMAENFLASLRPSYVRVSSGEVTCDACAWRVTVCLEKDSRTIKRIEQEVNIGLTGCRYGADPVNYAFGKEIPKETASMIINPKALEKLHLITNSLEKDEK